MYRRPPRAKLTETLFPYKTPFRSPHRGGPLLDGIIQGDGATQTFVNRIGKEPVRALVAYQHLEATRRCGRRAPGRHVFTRGVIGDDQCVGDRDSVMPSEHT